MLKDRLVIALTDFALASGCGPARKDAATGPSAPIQIQIVHPTHGAIVRSITLPAEVRAYQQTTLYAKVTGYLKTIPVDKGDAVKAGDVLAEIEAPELLADAAKAK